MERTNVISFLLVLSSSLMIFTIFLLILTIFFGKQNLSSSQIVYLDDFFPKNTSIILAGDVMLGRSVMGKALDVGDNFYPFRLVADTLKEADLVFLNLENPIVKDCPRHVGGFKFCTNYEIAEGLVFAGVDVVNLANNHTYNYGKEGFEETKSFLTQKGIDYVGDGNFVIKEVNETKYGFLGFDYTISVQNQENDIALIRESDGLVDVLILGVHWGQEYQDTANLFQMETAKKMVDAGADVIAGHHPHWVQNIEEINGKPVFYSLGNFIFDQMWSEETKKGILVSIKFEKHNIVNSDITKTYTEVIGRPNLIN